MKIAGKIFKKVPIFERRENTAKNGMFDLFSHIRQIYNLFSKFSSKQLWRLKSHFIYIIQIKDATFYKAYKLMNSLKYKFIKLTKKYITSIKYFNKIKIPNK